MRKFINIKIILPLPSICLMAYDGDLYEAVTSL